MCRSSSPVGPTSRATTSWTRSTGGCSPAIVHDGEWRLGETRGWPGSESWRSLVTWSWTGESRTLVVVNLGAETAAGHVSVPWDDLRGRQWRLADPTTGETFERSGDDLADGLYVELAPWGWHLFAVTPLD